MFRFRNACFFVISLLGAMATPAFAQYSGYYGEVFYGSGDTKFSFFSDLSDFEGDSDFYGLTIGRRFNDNIAAEVSYVELGESDAVISDPIIATLDSQVKSRALSISAIGNYPINRYFNVFAKFGINQWDLNASVTDDRFIPSVTLKGDDSGTGLNYGVGIVYQFVPSYSIKLEYLTYLLNTELFGDDIAIGGATVAFRYNY